MSEDECGTLHEVEIYAHFCAVLPAGCQSYIRWADTFPQLTKKSVNYIPGATVGGFSAAVQEVAHTPGPSPEHFMPEAASEHTDGGNLHRRTPGSQVHCTESEHVRLVTSQTQAGGQHSTICG